MDAAAAIFQVCAKTLSGRAVTLNLEDGAATTLGRLAEKCADKEGIPSMCCGSSSRAWTRGRRGSTCVRGGSCSAGGTWVPAAAAVYQPRLNKKIIIESTFLLPTCKTAAYYRDLHQW